MKNNVYTVMSIFLLLIFLVFVLVTYNNKSVLGNSERFYADGASAPGVWAASAGQIPTPPVNRSVGSIAPTNPDAAAGMGSPYAPSDDMGNEVYNPVMSGPAAGFGAGAGAGAARGSPAATCYPRDRLTADDLLPKDAANSRWAQMNPSGQGDVNNQNYLTAGFHVGVNTQGQSLRNANRQLRSDPPNPQMPVSPWNVSTVEYDSNRKQFEIGQ